MTAVTLAHVLAPGMALALLSVVWSALRAGSNTALFRLGLGDADAGADGGDAARPLVDDEEGRAFVQARTSLCLSALMVARLTRAVLRQQDRRAAACTGARASATAVECSWKSQLCSARQAVKARGR